MKRISIFKKAHFALALFLLVFLAGCKKEEDFVPVNNSDSQIAQSWYSLMLDLTITSSGHTPPIAARSFGYAGVTLYESLVDDMPGHSTLVGQLNGLSYVPRRDPEYPYAAGIVANAAMARIVISLFGNASAANVARIDSLEGALDELYKGSYDNSILNRSRNYGKQVADAIFSWSTTDGGYQAYGKNFPSSYIPASGSPGYWVPTLPLNQSAMLPYWGNNRPMIAANGSGAIDPPAPPVFSPTTGSDFYEAANEVFNISKTLTEDQRTIATYWADGGGTFTPPGHNIAIALQVINEEGLGLEAAAILLAQVGIAQNDAGIVCWRAKYSSNLLRPISYIRTYIDATWMPVIGTPPFPSYTSGHSTFSSSAAHILAAKFGDSYSFTDRSKVKYGFTARAFGSFDEAAQEAAVSRLYGGIHYRFDNERGYECGQHIAENILSLNW